jgi:UPF0755 protein
MADMRLSEVLPGMFDAPQDQRPRRGSSRDQRRRKKRRRRRTWIAMLLAVLVVGGAVGGAYLGLAPLARKLMEPDDYTGAGTAPVMVKIPEGASGRTMAAVLANAGVVKTQQSFVDALEAAPNSTVQPGTYELRKQMAAAQALTLLTAKGSRQITSVTIPEGMRAADVLTTLAKRLGLSRAALEKASTSGAIGLPPAAKGRPEGFLFPATYQFPPDVTPVEVLSTMVERAERAYREAGVSPGKLRSVAIRASIVQAEAGNQKYMGPIARVLSNRLSTDMPLQLDSTVSYATKRFGVTTTATERSLNSGYNTYRYKGLPAGPIGNPGAEAIEAVMDPPSGRWLFFVTVNPSTGETKFANDKNQHDAYVKQFQAWLRAHPNS